MPLRIALAILAELHLFMFKKRGVILWQKSELLILAQAEQQRKQQK